MKESTNPTSDKDQAHADAEQSARAEYVTPELTRLGTVLELTQGGPNAGQPEGIVTRGSQG